MQDTTVVKDQEIVAITNMTNHRVGYILDNGVRRLLSPQATIKVTAEELRQLSYKTGGLDMLQHYIRVNNAELAAEFGIEDVPEYLWTQKEIDAALTTEDMDVLLDALDFAPDGIVDAILDRAVELEIADNNRRQAINKRTGADIDRIIANKHMYDNAAPNGRENKTQSRRRRVQQ